MRRKIKASHIIAHQDGGHRHLRDGEIVWEANEILYVGPAFQGEVDETIDATGKIVTPGFINTHTHLYESPLDKSFVEDRGGRQFYGSGLFEYLPTRGAAADHNAARICLAYSMAELIRTGTTTVLEIGSQPDWAIEEANKVGMRLYMGQGFRSGHWRTDDGKTVSYGWDEAAGLAGLARVTKWIEANDGASNGRIKGYLSPSQVDTCTEDLLRRSADVARSLGVPIALPASRRETRPSASAAKLRSSGCKASISWGRM